MTNYINYINDRERFFADTEDNGRVTLPSARPQVRFKRVTESAIIPTKAHETDSGFDMYASEDVIIEPGETVVVPTGIAIHLPEGYEATVRPRSGVTSKTNLRVQFGTIDNGYRGEVGVMVDNISCDPFGPDTQYVEQLDGDVRRTDELHGYTSYHIRKGDKMAQLVVQYLPQVVSSEVFGDLDKSERGGSGYGSTGVNSSSDSVEIDGNKDERKGGE